MNFTDKYASAFRKFLPAPFTIALVLTLISFLLVLAYGSSEVFNQDASRLRVTFDLWYDGLWNPGGFSFAMQMMLMLLLGHVVALSKPIDSFLNWLSSAAKDTASAALVITFSTIFVSLFNWGLGLVFGALFARKIAEKSSREKWEINYGLIGACGYIGLMVWHGGISGSAPIKVADSGHLLGLMNENDFGGKLPDLIPMTETVFSTMNIVACLLLLTIMSGLAYYLGKRVPTKQLTLAAKQKEADDEEDLIGAEKLDASVWVGRILGVIVLSYAIVRAADSEDFLLLRFLSPDFINFSLLGLALVFHGSIKRLLEGVGEAIGGVSGILLQFPLYYGIMSLMQNSGLLADFADSISHISGEHTFPLMTFASAGAMNVFVPSGGGQWVVQGPVIVETAINNQLSLSKSIMAMAYGDQLTNMLQPFWALPLLAITGLKAKEILPYTLMFMGVGILIFGTILMIF
jgi:short-chain fatty acids transporter